MLQCLFLALLACVTPSFAWYWCWTIDFDDLFHGQVVNYDQYASYGMYIQGSGPLIAYDTTNPSIQRLGTPNSDFGGEGVGSGGSLLGQGLNTQSQRNVLVLQSQTTLQADLNATSTPNSFDFLFQLPITVTSLQLLDTGTGGTLTGYDSDGKTYQQRISGWGDNSLQTIHCGWPKIIKITIDWDGHGCIASITFCIGFGVPVNGGWCDWTPCNAPICGTGDQTRQCKCPAPANGGAQCQGSAEQACAADCPDDGTWGPWTDCSVPCGGGTQTRTCQLGPNGEPCPDGPSEQACNPDPCPEPGTWSDWSTCSEDCGGGTQTRFCEPGPNGEPCPCDVPVDPCPTEQACNTFPCPIDGGWGPWLPDPCSPCPSTQTRLCNSPPPAYGGADCVGDNERPCDCSNDPVNGNWTDWSVCSFSSVYLTCIKTRSCTNPPPSNGGLDCDGPTWEFCTDQELADSHCSTPCTNNPGVCQNGGTCNVISSTDWNCTCQPTYSGPTCHYCSDPQAKCCITNDQTKVYRSLSASFQSTIINNDGCEPISGWDAAYTFSWAVWNFSSNTYLDSSLFANTAYQAFTIAPFILTYGDKFGIELTITPPPTSTKSPSTCQTEVTVNGSRPSVIYTPPNIDLGCEGIIDNIVFDATSSYDTDYPDDPSRLTYLWTCFGNNCPFYFDGPPFNNQSVLNIPLSEFLEQDYNITLTVNTTDGRGSTFISTIITVLRNQQCLAGTTIVTCAKKVIGNDTQPLLCNGTITASLFLASAPAYTYTWEGYKASGEPIDLKMRTTVENSPYLALPAGSLAPGSYYFKLIASVAGASDQYVGQSDIITVVDSTPQSSAEFPFTITPTIGYAFNTQFYLQAHGFTASVDDNTTSNLNYTFSYLDKNGREVLLSGERISPLIFAYFPVGTWQLTAKVEYEGSVTRTTQPVTVRAEATPTMYLMPTECVVDELIGSQLQETLFEQDASENMQLILGLSNYLNDGSPVNSPVSCDSSEMDIAFKTNGVVETSRAKLNDQLIQTYLQVSQATYDGTTHLANATALQLAQTMTTLLRNTEWSGLSVDYLDQLQSQLRILIAQNEYGSATLGTELMASIGSLLRHSMKQSDCDRIQSLIPMIHSVLSGIGSQTLPGQIPFYVKPDTTISSVGQRILTDRDWKLALDGIHVELSASALSQLPTNLEAHIVQLPSTLFDSCQADESAKTQTEQNQIAKGKLIANVIDISLWNFDQTEVTFQSNSNQVLFSTSANPEVCSVSQGSTGVSCAWFDESIGAWSTEGCTTTTVYESSVNCACNHMTQFSAVQSSSCESTTIFYPLIVVWGLALVGVIVRAGLFTTRVSGWGHQHRVADAVSLPAALGLCVLFGLTFIFRLILSLGFLGIGIDFTHLQINAFSVISLSLFILSFALVVFEAYRSYAGLLSKETRRFFSQRARFVLAALFFLLLGECLVWGRADDFRIILGVWGLLDTTYIAILIVLSRAPPGAKPDDVDIADVTHTSPLVKPLIAGQEPDGFTLAVSDAQ